MTPQDVIDSYVKAVAAQLPFRQRGDVAQELRGQLMEELSAGTAHDEQTALALVRRFGRPAEVAAAVRFLACPEAGYITGSILKIDGGIL